MKRAGLVSALIVALLFACLITVLLSVEIQSLQGELASSRKTLLSLQQEYQSIQDNYANLQENYTKQQQDFMSKFTPSLETQLGAKVLIDRHNGKNYLWVTGEVYNRGFGIAYNAILRVSLVVANSSIPTIEDYNLGNIDAHNQRSVMEAFYSDGEILQWSLDAICTKTKTNGYELTPFAVRMFL